VSTTEPLPPTEDLLATGLTWRPLGEQDIPAWHALLTAIEEADQPAERYTRDDLHDELLDGTWKDPAVDSLVGLDDDGVPQAFGHVEVRPGDTRSVRAFCWGGVHPRWRRRGVGRALLTWQEALGRRKIADAGKDVPGRVQVMTEEEAEDRRRLLSRCGFAPVRWYIELSRPLAGGVPQVAPADGLRVVPFESALSEAVRLAHNEAFAEHWGSEPRSVEDWERWSVGGRNFRADWSFVVLDGDQVAGYTLASAYEQDWAGQGYSSGWTDLLGVRPAWRGRRLAPALLAASMTAMTASDIECADLGVDAENASGALGLYERLGYIAQRRQVAYAIDV